MSQRTKIWNWALPMTDRLQVQPNGTLAYRYREQDEWQEIAYDGDNINVKSPSYGAHGDDVTDDTEYLNNALADAEWGDTIWFPPGRYVVSNNVRVPNNGVRIKGEGATLVIRNTWRNAQVDGGNRVAAILDLYRNGGGAVEANRVTHVTIEGLNFEGTEDGSLSPDPDNEGDPKAITANSYASYITIRDCKFFYFGHEAIWPSVSHLEQKYWKILDCHFENESMDSMLQGSTIQCNFINSIVRGNTVINSWSAIGASGNDLSIIGNVIVTPGVEGIGVGDGDTTGRRCTILGNVVKVNNSGVAAQGSAVRGISLGGSAEYADVGLNTVEVIITRTDRGTPRGIRIASQATLHNVGVNTVLINQNNLNYAALGIHMEGSGSSAQKANIHGNTVQLINPYGAGVICTGIATTTGGVAPSGDDMTALIQGNMIYGFLRANNAYALDSNQNAQGNMRAHHLGNICMDGHQRLNSSQLSSSAYDNIPIYRSSEGNVLVNP
jgi:hypothetical protein